MNIFKVADERTASDNWLIAWTGTDGRDGHNYHVTTNNIHASEVHQYTRGANGDAELIAALLNWFYSLDAEEQVTFETIIKTAVAAKGTPK